jgi:membrane-associated phospholipid phosphatase
MSFFNAIIAFFQGNTFFWQWEADLIVFLQKIGNSFTDTIFSVISMFGEEYIMVAVLGFLYWAYDKSFGEFVGFNLLAANCLNPMIKNIANRRRPYFDNPQIQCKKIVDPSADILDEVAQGYSFPSGHSSGAASLYPSLAYYKPKRWLIAIAIVIPFLVGLSRIYLGVHFPTDVLGGWVLGIGIVTIIYYLRKSVSNKYIIYLSVLGISLLGIIYCRTNDYFTSLGMLIGFIAGIYFEENIVRFSNTRIWWRMILRVAVGGALYLALNALLKWPITLLPGGTQWLETPSAGNFAFRTFRYAFITFFVIGVYPLSFRFIDKLQKTQPKKAEQN